MDVLGSDLDEVRGDVHSISNKPYCAIRIGKGKELERCWRMWMEGWRWWKKKRL